MSSVSLRIRLYVDAYWFSSETGGKQKENGYATHLLRHSQKVKSSEISFFFQRVVSRSYVTAGGK